MGDYEGKDENGLRELLDSCKNFDERRKIRAAIRALGSKPPDGRTAQRRNSVPDQPAAATERRQLYQMQRTQTISNDDTKDYVTSPYEDLDEEQLRKALEKATNLDERVKIRSAIRKLKDGKRVERHVPVGINPTRREERAEEVNGSALDGSSETSSKSPSAYETASEPDTYSIPDTLSEPDLTDPSTPDTDGKESPLSTASSSSSSRSIKNDDKYRHITDAAQLEDLLRRTVDYFEKKRIRAQLNALKKEKGRVAIQRKKSVDFSRKFSNEELNNIRNSLDSNDSEARDEEIVKRLTDAANLEVMEKSTDSQDDSDKEFVQSLELSLKSLEREFDECKDFDKRRQIRSTIKDLRAKIRDHKRKIIEKKGSTSLADQNETVHIEKDIDLEDGHGRVSVKMSKIHTPSESTITEKETVIETERKTSDGEVFKEHSKITTKQKLTRGGSKYFETDAVNKKTIITESGEEEEEVDVYVEKGSKSVSKGESRLEAANAKLIPKKVKRVRSRDDKDAPASPSSSDTESSVASIEADPNYGIPEIVEPLFDQTVVGGDSVELACRVDVKSDLMLTIKWYRGHNVLEHSEDFYQVFDGRKAKLKIPYCEVEDEGVYSCVIRTRYGKAETKATLKIEKNTVKPVPSITLPLVDKTVTDGSKAVTLGCCLTSHGTIELEWYKDGKLLPMNGDEFKQIYDGQVAQLVIDEVFPEDTGHYKIIAKNASGEVSSECDLTVAKKTDPPGFDKELNDIKVEEGERVTLEVWVRGKPKPNIKWYYNNVEMTNTVDFKQTYRGSVARLIIREMQEEHSGTYRCEASNDAGESSTSSQVSARSAKKGSKPVISKALTDVDALDGDDVIFTCEVTGEPEPSITWFKNNKKLDKKSKDFVQKYDGKVATLTIEDVMTDDSADIRIVAENSEGRMESSCRLEVQDVSPDLQKSSSQGAQPSGDKNNKKPVFTVPLKDYTFVDGQSALLKCELEASSDTDVIWYKNGRELPNNTEFAQKFDGKEAVLDIVEVFPEDAGDYTCEAENDHGITKTSCTVKITEEEDDEEELYKEDIMSTPDINSIEDEDELHKMLQKTEDFDERKKIRARMKEVREKKAGRDLVGKHDGKKPGSVEETTSTSTKTDTAKDGSKTTTTTTTTTKKTSGPAGGATRPNFLGAPGGGGGAAEPAGGGPGLVRSPSAIKQMLLEWTKQQTAGYNHVNITNFSSSWNDGMAFCALIHSFVPKFDYSKLDPKRRRANFTLAFAVAEKEADIAPLLDVEDMVRMKTPDWKCVFTYVQSFYRKFRMADNKNPGSPVTPTTPKTPLSPEPTTQ